jgi:DNA topoisomerase-2
MKGLSREMTALLKKRVYDMAGILKVNVHLNGKVIAIKNFKEYVMMYVNDKSDLIFDDTIVSKRWSVMISKSDGQFQQISFVNSICTTKGGTHVNHIMDQII